jgi:peptidoglycan/LPS O-acetylase OafA/YrhL
MRRLRTARAAWTLAAASLATLALGFAVKPDVTAGWVIPRSAACALVGALIATCSRDGERLDQLRASAVSPRPAGRSPSSRMRVRSGALAMRLGADGR